MSGGVYVFVYGTLRTGEANDMMRAAARHGLPAPARVGAAQIAGRLYDFGAYPGLVLSDDGARTCGEIYRIADALVAVLDEIEEVYPGEAGLFVREVHDIEYEGTRYPCIVYPVAAAAVDGLLCIAGGDWVSYRRERDGR
ncbi:Gamma-glutamylcyclotransferase family protein YtfP [Pandoraea terrae]|uniref:Gamma-glutamylcyclotransferase family protein YtfP n=1 Tax=Pandoraea terrae TaxID=1537710 RepID=A0A5E4WWG1_9BURK|nr:gamma-glutamylcyclotransferase family protein [Pandoraea terrae]VVE27315.1 Gamma-glutamylcyclotransferase family protein YtfP [Pandoraea terrae]